MELQNRSARRFEDAAYHHLPSKCNRVYEQTFYWFSLFLTVLRQRTQLCYVLSTSTHSIPGKPSSEVVILTACVLHPLAVKHR